MAPSSAGLTATRGSSVDSFCLDQSCSFAGSPFRSIPVSPRFATTSRAAAWVMPQMISAVTPMSGATPSQCP